MNIGVIGASGRIGQRIVAEAFKEDITSRRSLAIAAKIPADKGKVAWKTADVFNADSVGAAMQGQDVLISSYGPAMGADPKPLATAAEILLKAGEKNPKVRVLMVGGAGSLEVAPGKTVIDSGLIPAQYIAIPIAHKEALDVFKKNSTVNWTYFSPAGSIQPGERTGKFRLGGDQLVVGENGKSEISMEDYAIAMLDEVEKPRLRAQALHRRVLSMPRLSRDFREAFRGGGGRFFGGSRDIRTWVRFRATWARRRRWPMSRALFAGRWGRRDLWSSRVMTWALSCGKKAGAILRRSFAS